MHVGSPPLGCYGNTQHNLAKRNGLFILYMGVYSIGIDSCQYSLCSEAASDRGKGSIVTIFN